MIRKDQTRPFCIECNLRPARSGGVSRYGYQRWRKLCGSCDSKKYRKQRQISLSCTVCGFVAKDVCQIDLINEKSICSNCNRLRIKQLKRQQREQYELTVDATVDIDSVRL